VLSASSNFGHHCGGRKIRAMFFFWQKTPNFEAISTQKHLLTPLEYTQTNLSTQNTKKKMSKNLKPNQVSFGFLILYMFYRQH